MNEKTRFLPDQEQEPGNKNNALIEYLSSGWNLFNIVKIERVNSTKTHKSGWYVIYLE